MAVIEQSVESCTSCGEPLEPGWKSCPACGSATGSGALLSCPRCGQAVKANWRLCPHCQTTLEGNATPSETPGQASADSQRRSGAEEPQIFPPTILRTRPEPGRLIEPPLVAGDVLAGRYTIRARLGAGGFGTVYQASDAVTKDDIALKIVVCAEGEDKAQRAIEQILHEFRLRQKISDIAHIVKCGDPRPCDFKGLSLVLLPMELAGGGSLRQWLTRCQDLDARRSEGLALFQQACLGVKAIHDAGLVHLDIKPENILLADGKAKITDFGIGRFAAAGTESNPGQLLRPGVGTPQFMSPEQFRTARQRNIGPTSDIYTLGVVLYEILDGALPFDGPPVELRDKHLTVPPAPLKGTAERWWGVVERCLAKAPAERYQSVGALLKDLYRVQERVAASVDVSCPKCRHINSNAEHKVCEACLASLAAMFRPCPDCTKEVRLDVERCSGCGAAVLAHYVLQERWKEVERLKLEDPVQAIELLELILRDGAGRLQERAVAALREMRDTQSRVSKLIDQAEHAAAEGAPERELAAWRGVLEIVPRHRIASEKVKALDKLQLDFRDTLAKSIVLADQADFEQAEGLLKRCQAMIPASDEVRQQFQTVSRRAPAYTAAMTKGRTERDAKRLGAASESVRLALAQAPRNKEALALRSAIDEAIKASERQLKQARKHIRCAEFEAATTAVKKLLELRADAEEGNRVRHELSAASETFSSAIESCEQAVRERDLGAAAKAAEQALQACPDCSRAKDMYATILNDKKATLQHLKRAKEALASARFTDANTELESARRLWPLMEGLAEARGDINSKRPIYERQLEAACTLGLKRQYDMARAACHEALRVCRSAKEPEEVLRDIEAIKIAEEAREHHRQAQKKDRIQLILRLLVVLSILGGVVAVAIHQRAWVQTELWPWLAEQLKSI